MGTGGGAFPPCFKNEMKRVDSEPDPEAGENVWEILVWLGGNENILFHFLSWVKLSIPFQFKDIIKYNLYYTLVLVLVAIMDTYFFFKIVVFDSLCVVRERKWRMYVDERIVRTNVQKHFPEKTINEESFARS